MLYAMRYALSATVRSAFQLIRDQGSECLCELQESNSQLAEAQGQVCDLQIQMEQMETAMADMQDTHSAEAKVCLWALLTWHIRECVYVPCWIGPTGVVCCTMLRWHIGVMCCSLLTWHIRSGALPPAETEYEGVAFH